MNIAQSVYLTGTTNGGSQSGGNSGQHLQHGPQSPRFSSHEGQLRSPTSQRVPTLSNELVSREQYEQLVKERDSLQANLERFHAVSKKAFMEFNELKEKHSDAVNRGDILEAQLLKVQQENETLKLKLSEAEGGLMRLSKASASSLKEFSELKKKYLDEIDRRRETEQSLLRYMGNANSPENIAVSTYIREISEAKERIIELEADVHAKNERIRYLETKSTEASSLILGSSPTLKQTTSLSNHHSQSREAAMVEEKMKLISKSKPSWSSPNSSPELHRPKQLPSDLETITNANGASMNILEEIRNGTVRLKKIDAPVERNSSRDRPESIYNVGRMGELGAMLAAVGNKKSADPQAPGATGQKTTAATAVTGASAATTGSSPPGPIQIPATAVPIPDETMSARMRSITAAATLWRQTAMKIDSNTNGNPIPIPADDPSSSHQLAMDNNNNNVHHSPYGATITNLKNTNVNNPLLKGVSPSGSNEAQTKANHNSLQSRTRSPTISSSTPSTSSSAAASIAAWNASGESSESPNLPKKTFIRSMSTSSGASDPKLSNKNVPSNSHEPLTNKASTAQSASLMLSSGLKSTAPPPVPPAPTSVPVTGLYIAPWSRGMMDPLVINEYSVANLPPPKSPPKSALPPTPDEIIARENNHFGNYPGAAINVPPLPPMPPMPPMPAISLTASNLSMPAIPPPPPPISLVKQRSASISPSSLMVNDKKP